MKKGPPFASKWKDGPYELRLIPDGGGKMRVPELSYKHLLAITDIDTSLGMFHLLTLQIIGS